MAANCQLPTHPAAPFFCKYWLNSALVRRSMNLFIPFHLNQHRTTTATTTVPLISGKYYIIKSYNRHIITHTYIRSCQHTNFHTLDNMVNTYTRTTLYAVRFLSQLFTDFFTGRANLRGTPCLPCSVVRRVRESVLNHALLHPCNRPRVPLLSCAPGSDGRYKRVVF